MPVLLLLLPRHRRDLLSALHAVYPIAFLESIETPYPAPAASSRSFRTVLQFRDVLVVESLESK